MSGNRNKKIGSVRDRLGNKKNDNGSESVGKAVDVATEQASPVVEEPKQKRTPATTADYLAAQFHEAQGTIMDLRANVMTIRQALLQKDQVILNLEKRILALEAQEVEKLKEKLRGDHGLALGRTLNKDDETGEIFWLETGR